MGLGSREIDRISCLSHQMFPGLQDINSRNMWSGKYSGVFHIPVSGRLKGDIRIAVKCMLHLEVRQEGILIE